MEEEFLESIDISSIQDSLVERLNNVLEENGVDINSIDEKLGSQVIDVTSATLLEFSSECQQLSILSYDDVIAISDNCFRKAKKELESIIKKIDATFQENSDDNPVSDVVLVEESKIPASQDYDLKHLELQELVTRYESIGTQAQLFQGRILLEIRSRFKSDNEFGNWIAGSTLCATTHQHRTRLMNLAKFFDKRDMSGISVTVAYEISAPKNQLVADKMYGLAVNKNLSVEQIKALIIKEKQSNSAEPITAELRKDRIFELSENAQKIMNFIDTLSLSSTEALKALQMCSRTLKNRQ